VKDDVACQCSWIQ
ncbi:hypothetical protein SOVF_204440, partial [Spinacia oleracea]